MATRLPGVQGDERAPIGGRFEQTEYVYTRPTTDVTKQHVAELLPHVQADVCSHCNNGWMSAMVGKARDLLDPMMRSGATSNTKLDADAQTLLAAWFSKCVYSYAAAALFSDATASRVRVGLRHTHLTVPADLRAK